MDEPGLVESFLLRAKATLDYIDELDVPEDSLDGLADGSFSAIVDRLDAADDFIVGALLAARPQIRGTDDDFQAAWDEAVAPYQRIQPESRAGLRALLLDLVQLLETAQWLSEHDHKEYSAEVFEEMAECLAHLEGALHLIDPSWHSARLARENDAEGRVALAARFESHEMHTESLTQHGLLERTLSEATRKLIEFEKVDAVRVAELRRRLRSVEASNDARLISDLVAVGLTPDEARVLAAVFRL